MARDSQAALVALNRFGLGARGGASGDFLNAASDPRGFVKAELARPNGVLLEVPGLQSTAALGKAVFDYQFEIQQARDAAAKQARAAATEGAIAAGCEGAAAEPFAQQHRHGHGAQERQGTAGEAAGKSRCGDGARRDDAAQRAKAAAGSRSTSSRKPFAPRRWRGCSGPSSPIAASPSGWWCSGPIISASPPTRAGRRGCGPARSSARRSGPYVLGRFADMLKAVEQHPAMLFFLDNQQSLGPDSRAGKNRNRGLNENLAREILELHTLGVGGGYSQDDVTSLANIITGWTYAGRLGQLGAPGTFVFNANAHQPGAQRVMGKIYDASAWRRARRCWRISRGIRRPQNSSPPNSRATSWPTIRHRRWWRGWPMSLRRTDGDLKALATGAGGFRRSLEGAARQRCARLTNSWSRPAGCWRRSRTIPAAISAASTRWASRCGRPPGRTVLPTATRPGRRRKA